MHYAPEGDDFGQWKRTFKCKCCQCRGVCGGGTTSGPSDLLEAMRQAAPPDWRRAAGLEGQGAAEVGRRVRVKTQDGSLVGNVMQQHESKVQVRGTLGRARQITSVMVDPRECEVIPDNLVWADLTISTSALRRVEYQQAATNQGDCSREYCKGWRGTIHGLIWPPPTKFFAALNEPRKGASGRNTRTSSSSSH